MSIPTTPPMTKHDRAVANVDDKGTSKGTSKQKRSREKQQTEAYIRDQLWRTHQSVATVCKGDGGYCQYSLCPGFNRKNVRKRSFPSTYRCYECSVRLGKNVFLCNTIKKGKAILCHMKYHTQTAEIALLKTRRK